MTTRMASGGLNRRRMHSRRVSGSRGMFSGGSPAMVTYGIGTDRPSSKRSVKSG
jgi:hypothetical protein